MRQLDLSQFAQYSPETPTTEPLPDPGTAVTDATLAQGLNNDFIARQQEILHDGPDAFYGKQGEDALSATPDVLDQLQGLHDQLLDMTVNPRQRRYLAQALDNHLVVSRGDVGRYAAQQSLTWQRVTAETRLALLQKQAALDHADPDLIANYAEAGRSAALDQARVAGLAANSDDATAMGSSAASAIWRSGIEAALAASHHDAAFGLYDRGKDYLAEDAAGSVARQIGAAHELDIARQYVSTIAPSTDLPSTIADVDAAHDEASTQNDDDWGHDPELWATVQHFLDVLFGRRRREITDEAADLDKAVEEWLNTPSPDGHPQTNLPPIPLWDQLDPQRQHAVRDVLKQNAGGASGGPGPGLLTLAADKDEDEDEDLQEQIRKFQHRPPRLDDMKHPHILEILPPLAPPGFGRLPSFRGSTPSRAPVPTGRGNVDGETKPAGTSSRPAVKTLAERFTSNREELRKIEPENPELSRSLASPTEEDLTKAQKALLVARLRFHGTRGRVSEDRVLKKLGLERNTVKVFSSEGASIPDALTDKLSIEVKDRAYVSLTKQLRIQADAADASGRKPILFVRPDTIVSTKVYERYQVIHDQDLGLQK